MPSRSRSSNETSQGSRGSSAAKPSKYDLLHLENQLCFALYAATRAMTKTYRLRLDPLNLTYPQYLVLLVLWEQDGMSVSEIGDKLMLDSGTLTPLLKRLERSQIIRRQRSSEDEREVKIWLTAKANELRDAVLDARKFVGCRLGMSEQQIMKLRADLMDMIAELDASSAQDAEAAE